MKSVRQDGTRLRRGASPKATLHETGPTAKAPANATGAKIPGAKCCPTSAVGGDMRFAKFLSAALGSLVLCSAGHGAEIKLYSTIGLRSVVAELIPEFEKASGQKVSTTFGLGGPLAKSVQDGE